MEKIIQITGCDELVPADFFALTNKGRVFVCVRTETTIRWEEILLPKLDESTSGDFAAYTMHRDVA